MAENSKVNGARKRSKPSDFNTDMRKRKPILMTEKDWLKLQYFTRLLELDKGLPSKSMSRQGAIQYLIDMMPDPPDDWTTNQALSDETKIPECPLLSVGKQSSGHKAPRGKPRQVNAGALTTLTVIEHIER